MNIRWFFARTPLVKILTVFVEHLNSMIGAIVYENTTSLGIYSDAMHVVHISRPLLVRRIPFLSPVEKKFTVLIEFRNARSVVAVRHKHRAVGKPCQEGWSIEVCAIRSTLFLSTDRLDQFFSVVCELIDGMHMVVETPYVFLRIVGVNGDEMRTLKNLVPLRPTFDDVSIGVRNDYAVLPFCIHSKRAIPSVGRSTGFRSCRASSRQRRDRSIAPGQPSYWKLNARTELGQQLALRAADIRQLTPKKHENSVRAFCVNALTCAVRPLLISGNGADIFWPSFHNLIGTEDILTAFRLRLCLNLPGPISESKSQENYDDSKADQYPTLSHNSSLRSDSKKLD